MTTTLTAIDCDAVPATLTVEQAHAIMQTHLRCHTDTCSTRRAARDLLVATGRYVLPAGR